MGIFTRFRDGQSGDSSKVQEGQIEAVRYAKVHIQIPNDPLTFPVMAVAKQLTPQDPAALRGLTEAEAASRLRIEGFNELPADKTRNLLRTAWDVIREPMILLLISAAVIYLFLGEMSDSLVLMGSIFFVVGIDLYQQRKTEHALKALRDLSSPRAMVIRDGRQRRVAGREVARGDIVIVSEGDRIPADGVLLSSVNLSVDESLLTGESVSVRKAASDRPVDEIGPPGGDDLPFVFSGTLVVQGQGFAEIRATGAKTE